MFMCLCLLISNHDFLSVCLFPLAPSPSLSFSPQDAAESPDNFALLRLQLSQALYYKLLGAIVEYEEKKVTSADGSVRYSSIQVSVAVEVTYVMG